VFGVIDQNQQHPMLLTHNLPHINIILEHRDVYRINASSVHAQSIFEQMGDDDAKRQLLLSIRAHLKPGAPLIVAGNQNAYASQPLLLDAWGQRWRQHGASPDEVKAKLGKTLQGADPHIPRLRFNNCCMTPDSETLLVSSAVFSGVPG
jgi:hypothetical protein